MDSEYPSASSVRQFLSNYFDQTVGFADDHRPSVAGKAVFGDHDIKARFFS